VLPACLGENGKVESPAWIDSSRIEYGNTSQLKNDKVRLLLLLHNDLLSPPLLVNGICCVV
jgi:hypothetical protein